MLKIAVCDDQQSECDILCDLLFTYTSKSGYECEIQSYTSGESLVADYEDGCAAFVLVFLDIYMNAMNGMAAARRIREYSQTTAIVFTTISPDFAVESYEVYALDYIVKPIVPERLSSLMDNFFVEFTKKEKYLLVKQGRDNARFLYSDIAYLESKGNKLFLQNGKGERFTFYERLSEVEKRLEDIRFLRCHQSYLVNMDYIYSADNDFILSDGMCIPIKVRERKSIREHYFEYITLYGGRGNLI